VLVVTVRPPAALGKVAAPEIANRAGEVVGAVAADTGRAVRGAGTWPTFEAARAERTAEPKDRAISDARKVIRRLRTAGKRARANRYAKKLLAAFPGRVNLALELLGEMLGDPKPPGARQWIEYAADRLIALNVAGQLPDAHKAVIRARKAMIDLHLAAGRLDQAQTHLRTLENLLGQSSWVRSRKGVLLVGMGRLTEARPLFDGHPRGNVDGIAVSDFAARIYRCDMMGGVFPLLRLGLEDKWEKFASRPLMGQLDAADALLAKIVTESRMLARGPVLNVSAWRIMEDYFLSQPRTTLAAWRKFQQRKARSMLAMAVRKMEPVEAFRRYSQAAVVHDALLARGDEMLARGNIGLACRAFRDVLSRSRVRATRDRAQVGLWLSLAQTGGGAAGPGEARRALESAFRKIPPASTYPWMGGRLRAGEIRTRLLASVASVGKAPAAKSPDPGAPRQRLIRGLPRYRAWLASHVGGLPWRVITGMWYLYGQVIEYDGDIMVVGNGMLARYDGRTLAKKWIRSPPLTPTPANGLRSMMPAPLRPAVVGGRIYCRWNPDTRGGYLTSLAAFSADSGRMVWTTAGDPEWAEMIPISDPTIADGRVFTLTAAPRTEILFPPIVLVCQDAADGRILWKRHLGNRRANIGSTNLSRYGAAVTVHLGEVYCSTSLGFIARCDARDGMVEWSRRYDRYLSVSPRDAGHQAVPPRVYGDKVLLLPRDTKGGFALNRHTGELIWDNPTIPSHTMLGDVDGAVLTAGVDRVAAVDIDSGKVRWIRRLDEPIHGKTILRGDGIYLPTRDGVLRLSAADGTVTGRGKWLAGRMYDFVLRDDEIIGIGDLSVVAPTDPPIKAPGKPGPLGLPLMHRWSLTRPRVEVLAPPPAADVGDRLYLRSESVLECASMTEAGRSIVWRRFILPRYKVLWGPKTLIAVWSDRVTAYDALTGSIKWRYSTDDRIVQSYAFGRYVVLANLNSRPPPQPPVVSVVDMATGKQLWRRNFATRLRTGEWIYPQIGWDGENLHFIFSTVTFGRTRAAGDLACRASDGKIAGYLSIPPPMLGRGWLAAARLVDGMFLYAGADGKFHRYRLRGGEGAVKTTTTPWPGGIGDIEIIGKWIRIRVSPRAGPVGAPLEYYLRLDNPKFLYKHNGHGQLTGDTLYSMAGRKLTVVNLPTGRKLVTCEIPLSLASRWARPKILSAWTVGDRLLTLGTFLPTTREQQWGLTKLRMDAFDCKTGRHIEGQSLHVLHRVRPSGYRVYPDTRLIWRGSTLLIAGREGVDAYSPAAIGREAPIGYLATLYRSDRRVVIDGRLDEWDPNWTIRTVRYNGEDASLMVTHDRRYLYLGVRYKDRDLGPRRGKGNYSEGDHLEIGLRDMFEFSRILLSKDDMGRLRVEGAYRGVHAAIGHDVATGMRTYEAAIAMRGFGSALYGARRGGLAVTLWDDLPRDGPTPVFRFGRGLKGRVAEPELHKTFFLSDQTRPHERACLDICKGAPDITESLEFLWHYRMSRVADIETREKAYVELMAKYARGPMALPALVMLDKALRVDLDRDTTQMALGFAKKAGMNAAAMARFKRFGDSYLTQWVYIRKMAEKVAWPPRVMLDIRLNDGRPGWEGWAHRAYWVVEWDPHRNRSSYDGMHVSDQQMKPYDQWVRLKVPLIWVGMHDRPIHAIAFHWNFPGYATIDRTAIGRGGKEVVVVDDPAPGRKMGGYYKWVDHPVKSGKKALTCPHFSYGGSFSVRFDKPITMHMLPPAAPIPIPNRDGVIASLRKNIPRLNGSDHGWRFFKALLRISAGDDLQKKIALYRWYLQANPNSPKLFAALGELWRAYLAVNPATAPAAMEAALVEARIGPKTAYAFRSDHVYYEQMFLRDWRIIGPFPDIERHGRTIFPPETEPVDLDREYEAIVDRAGWKLHNSKTGRIGLDRLFKSLPEATAYAVCWVHSEKETTTIVEFGMDDIGMVWLNRDAIISQSTWGRARPGMVTKKVILLPGWNEVLVKVTNRSGSWGFWLEMIAPDGRGMPKGLKFTTDPPKQDASGP